MSNFSGTTNFHGALSNIEQILSIIQTNVETDFGEGKIGMSDALQKISSSDFLDEQPSGSSHLREITEHDSSETELTES